MSETNAIQVVVFDDDKYPDGRATRVVEKLTENNVNVTLVKSWTELKRGLRENEIPKSALFVLDSSIEEPGKPMVSFAETIPWLLGDGGLEPWQLMPASGGSRGHDNNVYFERLLELKSGYITSLKQMGASHAGLSGDPNTLVRAIKDYYEEIKSKLEIKKEIRVEGDERAELGRRL